jgi:hypothetical protein
MANPRNTISFEGLNGPEMTFLIDGVTIVADTTGTVARGAAATMLDKAVSLSTHKTVQLASDGDAIIGRLERVEADGKAVVRTWGMCSLPGGASATLTPGTTIVGALGAASAKGYIRSAASGTAAELIKARGQIIDAGTPATTWVRL